MASIFSKSTLAAALLLLATSACSREDIELYPSSPAPSASATTPIPVPVPTDMPEEPPPLMEPPTGEQCLSQLPPGMLAPVPPMGWNGWNSFGCSKTLDAQKVKDIASALVSSGMQKAGYRFLDLDDCWELERSAAGDIVLDPNKLPSGMAELSLDLHASGFKLGVFRRADDCTDIPVGHAVTDAATYASWQVDLLKLASCRTGGAKQADYETMAAALRESGRPIVLSIVGPPFAEWMPDVGQMIRSSGPIEPTWASILAVLDAHAPLAAYTRPGAFTDPDILELGHAPLTLGEARAHFSLWSILAAPLLAGNDVTTMSPEILDILTNRELIALDQDRLGLQGALIREEGALQVYAKPLEGCGARGVVLFNRGDVPITTTLAWSELWLGSGTASVRDLWAAAELRPDADRITLDVPPHDVLALKVMGNELRNPIGSTPLGDEPWTYATNGFGPVERNMSNGDAAARDGRPIRIQGRTFLGGLGVHAPSLVRFRLGGVCSSFTAQVGVDEEEAGAGSVNFQVWADGEKLFDSGPMTAEMAPLPVEVSLVGRNDLRLFVGTAGDGNGHDHADWADAHLTCSVPEATN